MELKGRIAVVAITAEGGGLARRIADALGDAEVHGLRGAGRRRRGVVHGTRSATSAGSSRRGRPIAGVCAAGILVRSVAPALADKRAEPPVVAVSDDGAFAVPLLGGHRGRGRACPAHRGCGRRHRGGSPPRGRPALRRRPRRAARRVDPRESGGPASLSSRPSSGGARVRAPADLASTAPWLAASGLPFDDAGELAIRVDDAKSGDGGSPDTLVYRPAPARGRHRLRARRGAGRDRGPRPLVPRRGRPRARRGRRGVLDRPQVGRARGPRPRRISRRAGPVPSRPCPGSGGAAAPEPLGPRVPRGSAATGSRRARLSRRRGRRASSSSRRPSRCVRTCANRPRPGTARCILDRLRRGASWRWSGLGPR